MRWQMSRRSDNVEDQRGMSGMRLPIAGGGGLLVILLISWLLGINPLTLLEQTGTQEAPSASVQGGQGAGQNDTGRDFVAAVLGETEDVWTTIFEQNGTTYRKPKLVLFSGGSQSGCGLASAATGPFYCPGDEKVYLDMSFFQELSSRLGAPGDFAEAYVIAHEVGHHVQKLLGITDRVDAMRGRVSKEESNQLSVRLELQADFLAGVWAHHAQRMQQVLEPGDIEEALQAASAVGDDRLQRRSQGYVVPDAFTHGTSEQRVHWFKRGYETGDISQGDTFAAGAL